MKKYRRRTKFGRWLDSIHAPPRSEFWKNYRKIYHGRKEMEAAIRELDRPLSELLHPPRPRCCYCDNYDLAEMNWL